MCFEAFCLLVAQLGQVALTETIHLLAKYIAMDKSHVVEYLSCIFGKKSNNELCCHCIISILGLLIIYLPPFDTQQEVVSTFFKKSGDDMMLASIFIALFVVTFLAHSPTPSSYSYALVLQKQCYVNCLCGYETVSGYFYLSKSLNVRTSLTHICIFIRIT